MIRLTFRDLTAAAVLAILLAPGAAGAQDAKTLLADVTRAMGAENLKAITYSGTASDVEFLQTRSIAGPWPLRNISNYVRAIDLTRVALRSSGITSNPGLFGGPPVDGTFNQNIPPVATTFVQQVDYWVTPWGFLKGAEANDATTRVQRINTKNVRIITWSPPDKAASGIAYTVNGYLTDQNLIERVETWIEHDMLGDMLIDSTYTDYKDFGGLKVPTRMTQKRGGYTYFSVSVGSAKANPENLAQLLQAPPAGGGARGGAAAVPPFAGGAASAPASERLAAGVYKINGAYNALAVEFRDFVAVIEAPQSVARGAEILAEVKRLIPSKPVRYVINSHPHSDHASGLAPFIADGATVVTHTNNKEYLNEVFSAKRTLLGDTLSKSGRKPKFETVDDKKIIKDETHSIELYHIIDKDPERVHSNGMIVALLPRERILFQADFSLPQAGQTANPFTTSLAETVDRLRLSFDAYIPVHNSPAPRTRSDLMKVIGK